MAAEWIRLLVRSHGHASSQQTNHTHLLLSNQPTTTANISSYHLSVRPYHRSIPVRRNGIQSESDLHPSVLSNDTSPRIPFHPVLHISTGADDVYVPSLVWFEIADRFLSDIIKSRKTFQNKEAATSSPDIPATPSPDILATPSPDIPANPSPDIPANPSPDIPANPSPDIPANPSPDLPTNSSPNTSHNTDFVVPSSRKRIKKTLPPHITKSIETLQSIKDQAQNMREIEDEFCHFGRNVSSQLRQLPLVDALDVQSDILNLIKNKRQSIQNKKETSYTIEIPDELPDNVFFVQQEEVIVTETNDISENEVQNAENHTLLEQAIRSIGGFTQTPEE